MTQSSTLKVVMLVANSVRRDPRVVKEARSLSERGHDVVVFGLKEPRQVPERSSHVPFSLELLPEPIRPFLNRLTARVQGIVGRLVPRRGTGAGPSVHEEGAERASRSDLRRRILVGLRSVNSYLRFRAVERGFRRARGRILACDPDVIHSHDLNTLRPAAELARKSGAAVVYDSHEIFSEMGILHDSYRRWLRAREADVLRTISPTVITVSDAIADWFEEIHGVPRPLVVHNAPPRIERSPSPHERTGQGSPRREPVRFLYQGSLSPRRGIEPLVLAFSEIDEGAVLLLRGPGRLRDRLESMIRRSGIRNVRLLPSVAPDELVEAAGRDADVGIVPFLPLTLNFEYALPNKLFEYLAAGLAVLSTDLPEIRSLNDEFGFGRLYRPGDLGSLTREIRRMVEDRDRLGSWQRRAFLAHERQLNWERASSGLLETYDNLARERGNAPRQGGSVVERGGNA